jgi:hypothetical protein
MGNIPDVMVRVILLSFVFVLQLASFAAPSEVAQTEIEHLFTTVQNSKAKFMRNGDEHSGKDAAGHMKKKYNHFKKEIKTAEDFIEKCAAKSELSGKAYNIKEADGTVVDSKDWFLARLADYRKQGR